jgi:2-oxoglutarate dehydrogenase E1 component
MSTTFLSGRPRVDERPSGTHAESDPPRVLAAAGSQPAVQRFIEAHRQQGYRFAALDPLGASRSPDRLALSPRSFGLSPDEPAPGADVAPPDATRVDELDRWLKATYCGTLALDASAVRDEQRRAWLFARMETRAAPQARESWVVNRLAQAQSWEHHVARRFPDAKRFSLEGCETLVPLLDALLEGAARQGIHEVFMAMPHRGRLNVLVNVLGVPPAELLDYFDAQSPNPERHRDLVYHLGARRSVATRGGDVAVTLACNPSHLQSVFPVVIGMACASRARQRPGTGGGAMAIAMHGDAAFAGQGVVMETLALGQKAGYATGGTVHVVINNQVGFTEANRMDAQAPRYCTDVTRMVDAPVLRVNAEDPAAALRAAAIAVDYRAAFAADVVVDLIGYRRWGHSEHDLPMLTSPRTTTAIERHACIVERQASALLDADRMPDVRIRELLAHVRSAVSAAFERREAPSPASPQAGAAAPPPMPDFSRSQMRSAIAAMTAVPPGFEPHPRIELLIRHWREAADREAAPADWCLAENMAYASALLAGIDVRVSGLDVRRGTFFHRHAVWHDQAHRAGDADEFVPLRRLGAPGRFDVFNSVLSEEAVLGFEYGYSVEVPNALTIWEAQFGDFVNGAQIIVDQYLGAGEEKWDYRSALVLLLPHGYEGVGPEHSSAHLNRFLALCGGDNLRVACPSTSAQFFHLLRRQAFSAVRKPLVVMTPKADLHGEAASHSPARDLHQGVFRPVLADPRPGGHAGVTRVVLCSGKLYYDLSRAREAAGYDHVALLRLEELHPFPREALAGALARYPALLELVWAQEETTNQGAWSFVRDELAAACPAGAGLECVSRAVTAAGATSSRTVHRRQQAAIVAQAMGRPRVSAGA